MKGSSRFESQKEEREGVVLEDVVMVDNKSCSRTVKPRGMPCTVSVV